MDQTLKKIVSRLASFWKSAGAGKKTLIIGSFVLLGVVIAVTEILLNTVQYTPMMSGLSDADAGQIVTQLQKMGVRYKVQGDSIYVDSAKADETRMQLAEEGYPQSPLDYTSSGQSANTWAETDSDKTREAIYKLQNRLEATIETIPGVKQAVVSIGSSDNNTYVLSTDKVPTTASVKLSLGMGTTLTAKQVNGIVQLVSHGVSGLSPDNVTVLDSDGSVLSQSGGISGNTSDQIALQNRVEQEIEQKVRAILEPVYGVGNVKVSAGAALDFNTTNTSTVTYSGVSGGGVGYPQNQNTTTTISGASSGTGSGLTTYATTPANTSSATVPAATGETSQQTSYLYNTVTQQVASQGGQLKSLTIAVLLNSRSANAASINPDDLQKTVAFSVGMPDTQGVSVQTTPFAAPAKSVSSAPAEKPSLIGGSPVTLIGGVGLFAVGLGLLVLFLLLSHRRGKRRKAMEAAEQQPAVPAAPAQPGQPSIPRSEPVRSIEQTIEEADQNSVKQQISEFADKKPELVAQLLKNWLKD